MLRQAFAGFLLLLVLPLAATAQSPQPDECVRPSPDLVEELLGWIGAASGYDISSSLADPPEILFCAEGDVLHYPGGDTLIEPNERGLYDFEDRIIYLVAPWRPDDPRQVSVLLHELVHDVQFRNRGFECPNASEWEAYELQEAWLAERGIHAEIDWLQVWFWSKCPGGPHPGTD
jgi:hypothetical protein